VAHAVISPRGASVCGVHPDIRLHPDGGDTAANSFLVGFQLGPIFAIAQTVAKPSMRALASAFMLLTAAGFGRGMPPRQCAIRWCRPQRRPRLGPCCSSGRRGQFGAIYSAGELIRSARRHPIPFVFIIVLIPATSPPRAPLRVDRPVCDLHHGYWRKTDQNPAE
jgi:hypothetical protein